MASIACPLVGGGGAIARILPSLATAIDVGLQYKAIAVTLIEALLLVLTDCSMTRANINSDIGYDNTAWDACDI